MNSTPRKYCAAIRRAASGARALLLAISAASVSHASVAAAPEFQATVQRTTMGIAHVKAADYKGLGYGVDMTSAVKGSM